jgi:hypothetical protein
MRSRRAGLWDQLKIDELHPTRHDRRSREVTECGYIKRRYESCCRTSQSEGHVAPKAQSSEISEVSYYGNSHGQPQALLPWT